MFGLIVICIGLVSLLFQLKIFKNWNGMQKKILPFLYTVIIFIEVLFTLDDPSVMGYILPGIIILILMWTIYFRSNKVVLKNN